MVAAGFSLRWHRLESLCHQSSLSPGRGERKGEGCNKPVAFPLTLTLSPLGERGEYLKIPEDRHGWVMAILNPKVYLLSFSINLAGHYCPDPPFTKGGE